MADAVRLSEALSSLRAAASRLQDATDSANVLISQVQDELIALKIGFEYWMVDAPLVDSTRAGKAEIGFARLEGAWCLAVRPHVTQTVRSAGFIDTKARLLGQASRELRSRALEVLPDLLVRITAEVEKKADRLAEAVRPFDAEPRTTADRTIAR